MRDEQYSEDINPLADLLEGLSELDASRALNDIGAFGTCMVHVVDGVKRHIPLSEWVRHEPDPYHGIELRPVHLKAGTVISIDMPKDD